MKWEATYAIGIINPVAMPKPAECPECGGSEMDVLASDCFRCRDCNEEIIVIQEE